jgi:hypothetical protein
MGKARPRQLEYRSGFLAVYLISLLPHTLFNKCFELPSIIFWVILFSRSKTIIQPIFFPIYGHIAPA